MVCELSIHKFTKMKLIIINESVHWLQLKANTEMPYLLFDIRQNMLQLITSYFLDNNIGNLPAVSLMCELYRSQFYQRN